ncbi:MAG: FtsH protease activity modulator HflK [bacterium]
MNYGQHPNEFEILWQQFKRNFLKRYKSSVGIIIGVLALIIVFSSVYTIQPDEEGVVLRLGKYYSTTPPGLHFKLPLGIDKLIKVQTTRVHQEEFGFRTQSSRSAFSDRKIYEDESLMLTGDLNVADVEWVVHYKIADPYKYLFNTRMPQKNIRDVSESIMRRVVGDKLVTEVLTVGRTEVANDATILMQEVLDKYDMGVTVISVKLQDVNPPDMVKPSFNEVNEAKQEQEKLINQAEKAYNKVIPEARGKAEKEISEAQGYAEAQVNRAQGAANKFNSILIEYRKAPKVTKRRIYIETMEELFKRFEKMTIVDSKVEGLLPVFQQQMNLNNKK